MSHRLMAGYATLMGTLGAALLLVPGLGPLLWAIVGLTSVGAIAVGVRRHGPLRRSPWWLLAGGLAVNALGDAIYGIAKPGPQDPTPLLADICYQAILPLVVFGLLQLTRPSVLIRDRSRLLDLMTFSTAVVLLLWVIVVGPAIRSATVSAADRSAAATYAVGCLLLVVAVVGLVITARRSPTVVLLAVGAFGLLAGDVIYLIGIVGGGGWEIGGPGELAYLVFYAAWGAAALHPSMARLAVPVEPHPGEIRRAWRLLLGFALLIPPVVLLAESLLGTVADGIMIAATAIVIYALAFSRLYDAVEKHRRLIVRERRLREACGALVAAADADEVSTAVHEAVDLLMPAPHAHRVVFSVSDSEDVSGGGEREAGSSLPRPPATPGDRRTRLLQTHRLHPDVADQLGGFTATLVCSLALGEPEAADPPGTGTLLIAASEPVLGALQDTIEVLAVQATLALERISLTERINRRESEQYVSQVVRNTTDVVIIVDEADRVRYASPSLATVLGAQPRAFSMFSDLIAVEDRPQVKRTFELARGSGDPEGVRSEWSLRREDGSRIVLDVSCRDLRTDRLVRGFVITMCDSASRHQFEQDLIQRALLDSAPGKNRRSVANRFR